MTYNRPLIQLLHKRPFSIRTEFSSHNARAITNNQRPIIRISPSPLMKSKHRIIGAVYPITPYPTSPQIQMDSHHPHPIPPYALTGYLPSTSEFSVIQDEESLEKLRASAKLARRMLDIACDHARPGITTDEIDTIIHNEILEAGGYPSPLNYGGYPKSTCISVNEVLCHGIPDFRPLENGDVVSFDVSCYLNGFHGDNGATVIVGDDGSENYSECLGDEDMIQDQVLRARKLVRATKESLDEGILACRPGGCLSDIGKAIHGVVDKYKYGIVKKCCGHGIGKELHCAPTVKHCRNNDKLELVPGMVFTIEPILSEGHPAHTIWSDRWTVSTLDGGLTAQFEHMVMITESGVEVLTEGKD